MRGLQLDEAPAPQPCQITVVPELRFFGRSSPTIGMFEQSVTIACFEPLRGRSRSRQGLAFDPAAANGTAPSAVGVLRLGD